MKTIKTTLGEVRFCDCIAGMKELGDKSFDLCLTDPPFNVKYNGLGKTCSPYKDDRSDYEQW